MFHITFCTPEQIGEWKMASTSVSSKHRPGKKTSESEIYELSHSRFNWYNCSMCVRYALPPTLDQHSIEPRLAGRGIRNVLQKERRHLLNIEGMVRSMPSKHTRPRGGLHFLSGSESTKKGVNSRMNFWILFINARVPT